MERHEIDARVEELERVYWQTLRELEALLRPPADDDAPDAPPLAA